MLLIAVTIPLLFFFFMVVSREIVDGKIDFIVRAKAPEIIRTLVAQIPLMNVLSSERSLGDDQFAIWLAIGFLSAPFVVPLFFAPTNEDVLSLKRYIPKWFLSKLEGLLYGLILVSIAIGVLSLLNVSSDLPNQFAKNASPTLTKIISGLPGMEVCMVMIAGVLARVFVIIRSNRGSKYHVMFSLMTIVSALLASCLWLLAVGQTRFEASDWTAHIGGIAGLFIAIMSDRAFHLDLLIHHHKKLQ